MEIIIVSVAAFGLVVYLFWTLIRPENFELLITLRNPGRAEG